MNFFLWVFFLHEFFFGHFALHEFFLLSLRLSVRQKATRGTDVNTLVQRGEEDRVFLYDRRYRPKGRVVCDDKTNATGLVGCGLTGFECDSMNALDLVFEERAIVATVVKVLDKFISS